MGFSFSAADAFRRSLIGDGRPERKKPGAVARPGLGVDAGNQTRRAVTGELLLIAGELDTNVDPASTAQVVAALQKADKDFEFLPIINAGHGAAETPYGKRRRAEFLMRHLGVN